MRFTLPLSCLIGVATATAALDEGSSVAEFRPPTLREERPFSLSITAGDPSPAIVGGRVNWTWHRHLQMTGAAGYLWVGDLRVWSVSGGARVPILRSRVTPVVGAGVNVLLFSGTGVFQELDSSKILGTLMLGVDWLESHGFCMSMGWNFHFPVTLGTPFVNVGYAF